MRVLAALIAVAIGVTSANVIAARPEQAASSASVSGTASDAGGRGLSNTSVHLRSVSTGQLAGSATTNGVGQFSFVGVTPGTYVIEVTNAAGQAVGTSGSIAVSAGAAVTGVGVTTAAAGAAGAAATTVAAHGLSAHIPLILGAAAAAGVAGGVAAATGGDASPSQ